VTLRISVISDKITESGPLRNYDRHYAGLSIEQSHNSRAWHANMIILTWFGYRIRGAARLRGATGLAIRVSVMVLAIR
jgi:hypothetical protein